MRQDISVAERREIFSDLFKESGVALTWQDGPVTDATHRHVSWVLYNGDGDTYTDRIARPARDVVLRTHDAAPHMIASLGVVDMDGDAIEVLRVANGQ